MVLYHAGPLPFVGEVFTGGFVGVDIFFVISGFLITGRLVAEAVAGEGVQMREFYSRRVRRTLPAATVVILATIAASLLWQSPLQWQQTAADARAATLFASNYHFAAEATDYLGEARSESLFQQSWSLSLEEQFYFLWPGVMLRAVWLAHRVERPLLPVLTGGLGAVVIASFAWSVYASTASPLSAFFVLFTRAWELGVGALLAWSRTPWWVSSTRAGLRPSSSTSPAGRRFRRISCRRTWCPTSCAGPAGMTRPPSGMSIVSDRVGALQGRPTPRSPSCSTVTRTLGSGLPRSSPWSDLRVGA